MNTSTICCPFDICNCDSIKMLYYFDRLAATNIKQTSFLLFFSFKEFSFSLTAWFCFWHILSLTQKNVACCSSFENWSSYVKRKEKPITLSWKEIRNEKWQTLDFMFLIYKKIRRKYFHSHFNSFWQHNFTFNIYYLLHKVFLLLALLFSKEKQETKNLLCKETPYVTHFSCFFMIFPTFFAFWSIFKQDLPNHNYFFWHTVSKSFQHLATYMIITYAPIIIKT